MRPSRLRKLIQSGNKKVFSQGELFHSLDFNEDLYVVKTGFVKRYSVNEQGSRVIESIYGPDYFFPLSPVFMRLFDYNLNQPNNTYVYQAMTDIELNSIGSDELQRLLKKDPQLYADLLYETGRRLKVDIDRLTSNSLKDDYQKISHQLVCLAEEFCETNQKRITQAVILPMPLTASDIAEQLNITVEATTAAMKKLTSQRLIKVSEDMISIPSLELLKDAYLR